MHAGAVPAAMVRIEPGWNALVACLAAACTILLAGCAAPDAQPEVVVDAAGMSLTAESAGEPTLRVRWNATPTVWEASGGATFALAAPGDTLRLAIEHGEFVHAWVTTDPNCTFEQTGGIQGRLSASRSLEPGQDLQLSFLPPCEGTIRVARVR